MNIRQGVWLLTWAAVSSGCGTGSSPSTPGELGNGRFRYACVGNSDPFCPDGMVASSFPEAIAVSSRFSLTYEPDDDGPTPVVEPASRAAVTKQLDVFTLQQPGYVAVLAQTAFGDVVDLLHLTGRHVTDMTIVTGDMEQSTLRLGVGEQLDVTAEPRDEFQTLLAGSLQYLWTADDPSIFQVVTDTDDDDVTLEGVAQGSSVLHIQAGGYAHTIEVEIGPDSGGTGTTGGTDTTGGSSGEGTTGTTGTTGSTSTADTSTGTTSGTGTTGTTGTTGATTGG